MIFVFCLAFIIACVLLKSFVRFAISAVVMVVALLWRLWMQYWTRSAANAERRASGKP